MIIFRETRVPNVPNGAFELSSSSDKSDATVEYSMLKKKNISVSQNDSICLIK